MKTKKEIQKAILQKSKEIIGAEGSKAHRLRGEMEMLNWVIE